MTTNPGGGLPPSYGSNTGSIMPRRSSYASVLSGAPASAVPTSQLPRPVHPNQPYGSTSPGNPHHYSPQHRMQNSPRPASLYNMPRRTSGSLDSEPLPPFSQSFSHFGDGFTPSMAEMKMPEFFIPSYLRRSRHMEKLREKYKAKLAAFREGGRSNRHSTGGSLSTSASSMSLYKMGPHHRGMNYDITEHPVTRADEKLQPLPTRWNTNDKHQDIEVGEDGLGVTFVGSNVKNYEGAAIRADHPAPRECGLYYYELTIKGSKGKDGQVGFGLSGPNYPLNRIPGWESDSWAYHADDGNVYSQTQKGDTYGQKFGAEDTVGCGINFRTGTIFFTRNGVYLGTAFKDVHADKLYPIVGMKKQGEHVQVNYGRSEFVFDIDRLVDVEHDALLAQIEAEDTSSLHKKHDDTAMMQELVAQYLAHEGFMATASAFAEEARNRSNLLHGTGSTVDSMLVEEDIHAAKRQRIRQAVLDGDIDRAIEYTNVDYPKVLTDNENIYFKLRCRKFVEMIRKCSEMHPRSKRPSNNNYLTIPPKLGTNGHYPKVQEADYPDVFDGKMELDNQPLSSGGVALDDDEGERMDIEENNESFNKQANLTVLQYGQELQSEFKDDLRPEVKRALQDTFALMAYQNVWQSPFAHLLETSGRVPVAEELNSAILVSLGQSSMAALERLVKQTEVLIETLSEDGGTATLINVKKDYLEGARTMGPA